MKIAICDDDKNELFHILSLLADYQIQKNTDFSYKPFESSMELATNAAEERYDIYLLDVVMPGLNGMELAKEIRSYDKAADIIFLTTSPEFAVESYTVKASNYLIKPIQKDRLFDALDDIMKTRIEDQASSLVLKSSVGVHKVRISEIIYVEALNRKVIYYLKNNHKDTSEYDGKLDVFKSSLETAQNALDSANDNYASVLKNTDRSVASAQNTVDMQKYQASTTTESKDQLEQLQKQLADCTLSAPIGGVVTAVNVSVGDKNTAGTTMITIEDTSSLKVIVNVEEADILKIQEGMPATVSTDATGDEEIKGTVTRVVRVKNQSTNTNGTDTNTSSGYSAEITIDNTELLVGMSAKAKIVIKDRGTQLAVPYDLIRQDDNGDSYVLVAEANEDGTATAVRKNIKVGEEVDYYTEVTGGDLKEGDQLIYDNTFSVTEGQVFTPEQIYSNQALDTEGMMSTEAE